MHFIQLLATIYTMNYPSISKAEISLTLKELFFKAFIPQAAITSFYVICNWSIVTLWLTSNYNTYDTFQLLIIGLLGGTAPFVSYGVWAIRRFIVKSYLIIYDRIIHLWLEEFCNEIAIKISENKTDTTLSKGNIDSDNFDELEIIQKLRTWIVDKSQNFPIFIKKIIHFVLKKIDPTFEIEQRMKNFDFKNPKEISEFLKIELAKILIDASNRLIPYQVIYLIPINIILLITLWLY